MSEPSVPTAEAEIALVADSHVLAIAHHDVWSSTCHSTFAMIDYLLRCRYPEFARDDGSLDYIRFQVSLNAFERSTSTDKGARCKRDVGGPAFRGQPSYSDPYWMDAYKYSSQVTMTTSARTLSDCSSLSAHQLLSDQPTIDKRAAASGS